MPKALLIDVEAKQVREVVQNSLQDMYALLGCDMIEITYTANPGIEVVIDEEGLLREPYIDDDGNKHHMRGFQVVGNPMTLVGNGLLVRHDEDGGTIDVCLTAEQGAAMVTFVEYENPLDRPQPRMVYAPFK